MKTKVCSGCKTEKPLSEFYTHNGHKDGFQSYCKECQKRRGKNRNGGTGIYRNSLGNFTDVQLRNELRKRGWHVDANKKIVKIIKVDL